MGWARTYLKKAGLLDAPKRGMVSITGRGLEVLRKKPKKIDNNLLKQFPEFLEFQNIKKEESGFLGASDLGVSVQRAYEINRLDNDYFEEA